MTPDTDRLQRFILEGSSVRGEVVHLDDTWQTLLSRRRYPAPVRLLLGEALAAVALLAATIKCEGSLILQARGDGPLNMLVVEATGNRTLRGLARWRGAVGGLGLAEMVGSGRLAMTIDPGEGRERYQGIVDVAGDNLSAVIQNYFERSEQLPTRLWLASDERRAAGLLLQQMPGRAGAAADLSEDPDAWNRSVVLAETVTPGELLGLESRDLLRRLYHEERVRVFEPEAMRFACGCSSERVKTVLRSLGHVDIQELVAEQGVVSVDCEFCNAVYEFDAVDVEQLFASVDQPDVGDTRH